jgi:hypothetical protein
MDRTREDLCAVNHDEHLQGLIDTTWVMVFHATVVYIVVGRAW